VYISAKVSEENEISPDTNYVLIDQHGTCRWYPRYELSITQCPVDVTWYPFDEQTCDIAFESWVLLNSSLKLHMREDPFNMDTFLEPDEWHLIGTSFHQMLPLCNVRNVSVQQNSYITLCLKNVPPLIMVIGRPM